MKETEKVEKNKDDIFTCDMCKKKQTREQILTRWESIPFVKEEKKQYYCGCMGWE